MHKQVIAQFSQISYSIFGHMVPVGSTAHMYSVTKFALKAITEGIRQELRVMDSGIKITVSI